MPRLVTLILTLFVVGACAPRASLLDPVSDAPTSQLETVFVGTTRALSDTAEPLERKPELTLNQYLINVPSSRKEGVIPYPGRGEDPDPEQHFLLADVQTGLSKSGFRSAVSSALRNTPNARDTLVVYVYGYNNTFADGLFRTAQMRRDLNIPGIPVHYAWPSAGHPLGYAYDRDSALFARDGLEQLLKTMAATHARDIIVVAHSMGSLVTMEALRQIHLTNDQRTISKISGVILLSPDLDLDVFRAQAARIDPLPNPFLIFTSQRDRALAVSARITGQTARLGNLTSVEDVADLDVTLIDLSNVAIGAGDAFNHFTAATSPAVIQILRQIGQVSSSFDADPNAGLGLLPGTVLSIRNATQVILSPGSP